MRKLIWCKAKQAFLTPEATWTRDIDKARVFDNFSVLQATTFQFPGNQVEVYYSFDPHQASQYDFTVGH